MKPFEWRCPYCSHWATITYSNQQFFSFRFDIKSRFGNLIGETLLVTCPNPQCSEIELHLGVFKPKHAFLPSTSPEYLSSGDELFKWRLLPSSRAKPMPAFVPAPITEDYTEACAIETLSPKASATLARRCVQQILRDFFEVKPGSLYDEMAEIQGKVTPDVWAAVDGLRQVGNIGAHAGDNINQIVDVGRDEAGDLIVLIELLIEETYVARDRQEKHVARVKKIAADKKSQRAAAETTTALLPGAPIKP
ncbi:MAG TPA: DUF4145 domain-containing protein [Candidatus Tumulicola sp.]